jgi:MFS family permease
VAVAIGGGPSSLWRNRDYMLLWAGQAVSSFGSQITQLTFPLLVLAITGSPAQAGFVGALRALPFALLSLPAGALVDRWDRKRLMIWCDAGRAVALGSVPLALALGLLACRNWRSSRSSRGRCSSSSTWRSHPPCRKWSSGSSCRAR